MFSIQLFLSPGSITSGVQAEASLYRDLHDYSASSFFPESAWNCRQMA